MSKHKTHCQCCICKTRKGEYKGKNSPNYGRNRPDLIKRNEQKNMKDKNNPAFIDGRTLKKYYCIDCDKKLKNSTAYLHKRCISCSNSKKNKGKKFTKEHKNKIRIGNLGKKMSLVSRKKMSNARKEMFKNIEFKNRVIRNLLNTKRNKINKSETILKDFLTKILPKKYKFVGDGKIILDGLNPDFININGQKKIIELYGDYWHNLEEYKNRDKRRIKSYKKYGYKTLIIWQHELKNLLKLKDKIKDINDY